MTRVLAHRGPDGAAVWRSKAGDLHFAHRRLAVIDLSETGRQPMTSADGRWTICFNGEIYNYRDLQVSLRAAGAGLRGESDTEALLETIARKGLLETLAQCEGMFAFALWDERDRRLYLVRDRIGVKPLYWMKQGRGVAFGSELKALRQLPGAVFEFDLAQCAPFFRYGYFTAPATPFRNVFKVAPGSIVSFGADGDVQNAAYWSAWTAAEHLDDRDDESLIDALDALVRGAVRQEMVADVPIGCFLSGGVDSSLVAALAQREAVGKLQTFSVGFDDASIDETESARAVAGHIGAEHHEIRLDEKAVLETTPLLASMFDEPVADMAQIPTYLVAKLARQKVTVALSGDGGDELFAGYDRYWTAERVWRRLASVPAGARKAAAGALRSVPARLVDEIAVLAQPGMTRTRATARFARLRAALNEDGPRSTYRATTSLWLDPSQIIQCPIPADDWSGVEALMRNDPVHAFQLIDLHAYLPDDVLAKVDRATMAAGLEARVPLLNHRLVEFAVALPRRVKRVDGRYKWLLRQVLHRYVPPSLTDRPKQGFALPMGSWLRGALRPWASELLSERALGDSGLQPGPILQRWNEHLEGRADWMFALWAVLTFQAWRQRWLHDC